MGQPTGLTTRNGHTYNLMRDMPGVQGASADLSSFCLLWGDMLRAIRGEYSMEAEGLTINLARGRLVGVL